MVGAVGGLGVQVRHDRSSDETHLRPLDPLVELEQGELGLHQPGLRLHQPPPLLHSPGGLGQRPPEPHGRLGRGRVHVDLASLHHGAVEPLPGGGRLLHGAHGYEAEPLGALLVEDDLGVGDAAVAAEEALEVGGAESEGEVRDVEAAGELLRRLPSAELLAQVVAGGLGGGGQGGREGGVGGTPVEVAPLGGGEVDPAQPPDQVLAGGLVVPGDGLLLPDEALGGGRAPGGVGSWQEVLRTHKF